MAKKLAVLDENERIHALSDDSTVGECWEINLLLRGCWQSSSGQPVQAFVVGRYLLGRRTAPRLLAAQCI